jgi:Cysteine rich repeat
MIRSAVLVLAGSLLLASTSFAQGPPSFPLPLPFPNFEGTPEEQRACRPDVVKLCKDYLAQKDKTVVLRCLQANKVRLSGPCHGVLAHYGQI